MKMYENEINNILQQNDAIRYEDLNDTDKTGLTATIGKTAGGDVVKIDFLKHSHLLVRRKLRKWKKLFNKLHCKKSIGKI